MFIRKKTAKNKDGSERTYAQVCRSVRIDGKPVTKVLFDFGRIDTPEGKIRFETMAACILKHSEQHHLLDLSKDVTAEDTQEFGTSYIFRRIWKTVGLERILIKELKGVDAEFDIQDALFNMTLNRLSAPSSKRNLENWQDQVYGLGSFDVHQYYRAMDYLIDVKEGVEISLFNQVRDLFHMSVDVVLFDTTSLVYYGEGDKSEDLLQHGFSKARRGDLKQIVIGVIMSKDGYPLGHEVFSGNTNDRTCFKEILEKVSQKFKLSRVVLVGDRGMISKQNINQLESCGYQYVLGFRMRTIPKEDRATILSKANLKIIDKDKLHYKQVEYDGTRLLVCYNPERAVLDRKKREDILEKITERLKSAKDVKSVVSNKDYKKFLRIVGKKPEIDDQKIKDDAIYDGVYVISSNTGMTGTEIIESYKDLWQIEAAFRQLKSEIELGPVFHWKDRRIRAHVMICFFALMMRTILNKRLRKKYPKASYSQSIRDLKEFRAIHLRLKDTKAIIRTEIRPAALQAVKAMGMRSPSRILEEEKAGSKTHPVL